MDILKLSTEWAKAELFSAKMVWLFSFIVLLSAAGFALWGKTVMAKAFVIPLIVSGLFLIVVGVGLYAANKPRIEQFEKEFHADAEGFIKKEIVRTTKSQGELKMVFKILPAIIIVSALLMMFFSSPYGRTITVTLIATGVFLMIIDSNTEARNNSYREELIKLSKQ